MNCAQTTTTATTIYGRKHSMNNWSIAKAFDDYFRPTRRVQTYDELSQLLKWFRGKNIEIKYLSLRNGEKIIEALIGKNEKIINIVEDSITKIVSSPLNEDVKLENWQTFFN